MKNIVVLLFLSAVLKFQVISQPTGFNQLYFSISNNVKILKNDCNYRIKITPLNSGAVKIVSEFVKEVGYRVQFQRPAYNFSDLIITIEEKVGILKKGRKMTLILKLNNLDAHTRSLYLTINTFTEGSYTIIASEILEKRYEGFMCNDCNPPRYKYKKHPENPEWDITPDYFKQ